MVIHRIWYYQRFHVPRARGLGTHKPLMCAWVLYLLLIMNDSNTQQTCSEDWPRVSEGDVGRTGDVKVSESRLGTVEVGMLDSLTPGLHISF